MNLAEFQRFTAGLAHEIRNPLNSALIQLHLLERNLEKAAAHGPSLHLDHCLKNASNIHQEVERLNLLLDDLFLYVRPYDFHLENEDLREVLDETIEEALAKHGRNIHIVREYEELPPAVRVDRSKLRQALLNLLLNAFEAIPSGGAVQVRFTKSLGSASIYITDDGPGISEEDLPHIFDVFYSTKEMGTGLGLPVARRIIEEQGGTLRVSSGDEAGTTFVVTFLAESNETAPLGHRGGARPLPLKRRSSDLTSGEFDKALC